MTAPNNVVLLDMDDVLALCTDRILEIVMERFGVQVFREEVLDYNIEVAVQKKDPTLPRETILSPIVEPGFFFSLEVVEGAKEGVQELIRMGLEPVILTKSPFAGKWDANPAADKMRWLHLHFPEIARKNAVIMTALKHLVVGSMLIDDAPHNIEAYPGKKIVFDCPWNQGVIAPRAHCWAEIPGLCEEILREGKECKSRRNSTTFWTRFGRIFSNS